MRLALHLALLRGAAWIAPRRQREEWLAEWRSELWYVWQACDRDASHGKGHVTAFCLGSFKDAMWLRRNNTSPAACGTSPLQCVSFLAVLAALSLFLAVRLPGPRDPILPSFDRAGRDLVMVTPDGHSAAATPTVLFEEYRSLTKSMQRVFTGLAFYRPIQTRVRMTQRQTSELSVALASTNLFDLLDIPISSAPDAGKRERTAVLILSETAWRRHFHSDPHVVGQVLEVDGREALVGGIIPADAWRPPGRMDAWLLQDEPDGAAKGFVVAKVRASARHLQRGRWRVSIPNKDGGYDGFDCAPLDQRQPLIAFLVVILVACLILPATTSLSLGEYPATGCSPPWAKRLRRWIFLAIKIAFLLLIVYCGSFDLAYFSSVGIQTHAMLWGCVFGFRWALIDQRRRCPVCLRMLTNPARIGRPSQNLLAWYGTELICVRGHGLLHVPEITTSWSGTQRWLYLDHSWSNLFS
jgi:hypothetical protein